MKTRLALAALILIAAALRSFNLDGMSLWTDEGLSFYRATKDLAFILSGRIDVGLVPTRDVQPPLYFLLLASWFKLLGATPWVGKAFSLLVSLPAIPVIWALARRLAGRRAAWPAALFAAVSPVYLWYAQDVRHYTLLVTLAAASLYALVVALDIPRASAAGLWPEGRRRVAALVGALALAGVALWVHYLGVFLVLLEVGALFVVGLMRWRAGGADEVASVDSPVTPARRGSPGVAVGVAVAALVLLAIPLVPFAFERLRLGAERDQHFVQLPVILRDVALQFTLGVAPPTTEGWAVLLVAALAIFGVWRAWRRDRPAATMLAASLLVPVLGLFTLTFVKPVYMGVRHILLASPAWYVILGAAVALPPAWTRVWARRAAATAGVAATFAIAVLMVPKPYESRLAGKDDLRSMAGYIEAHASPGDVLLLSDPVLAHVLQVYLPEMPIGSVPMPGDPRPAAEQFQDLDATAPRIWFMTPGDEEAAWLDQHRAGVVREEFEGHTIPVRVEAWDRELVPGELDAAAGPAPESEPLTLVGWEASPAVEGSIMRVHLALDAEGAPRFLTASARLLDEEGHEVSKVEQFQRPGEPDGPRTAAIDVPVPAGVAPGNYDVLVSLYVPEDYIGYMDEPDLTWPAGGPLFLGQVPVQPAAAPVMPDADPAVDASAGGWRVLGMHGELDYLGDSSRDVAVWVMRSGSGAEAKRLRVSVIPAGAPDSVPVSSGEVELPEGLVPGVPRLLHATLRPSGSTVATEPDWDADVIAASFVDAAGQALILERPRGISVRAALSGDDPTMAEIGDTLWFPLPPAQTSIPDKAALTEDVDFEAMGTLLGLMPDWNLPDSGPIRPDNTPDGVAVAREAGGWRFEVGQTAGESTTLPLLLYWRAAGGTSRDLVVSVQLLPPSSASDGRPVAQDDSPPRDRSLQPRRPTSGWRSGEVIEDVRTLELPPDLPPGDYTLAVTVYDPGHRGSRIPATVDAGGAPPGGGTIQDNLVPIATVRVGAASPAGQAPTTP